MKIVFVATCEVLLCDDDVSWLLFVGCARLYDDSKFVTGCARTATLKKLKKTNPGNLHPGETSHRPCL
jgi:hypothetical protein